jgi:hypothetical protein
MSPTLSYIDDLAIRQSLGICCGVTALHLILEKMSPTESAAIKESIIETWRGMWRETFQRQMAEYTMTLNKVTNSHKLDQPEDFQEAFNKALADAEKNARVTLRMEE